MWPVHNLCPPSVITVFNTCRSVRPSHVWHVQLVTAVCHYSLQHPSQLHRKWANTHHNAHMSRTELFTCLHRTWVLLFVKPCSKLGNLDVVNTNEHFCVHYWNTISTARKRSCEKVMFSQVSTGGGSGYWFLMAATKVGGTHPTGMHSCFKLGYLDVVNTKQYLCVRY